MALIHTIFFYLVSITFFFGPALRISFLDMSLPIFDILLSAYLLTLFLSKSQSVDKLVILFLVWVSFSFIVNIFFYSFSLTSFFYLIKLFNITLLLFVPSCISPKKLAFFKLIIFSNIVFGFIQYFFWPDLTLLEYYGWDPHLNRLTSTFLDPTYTGLIYLFALITSYYLNSNTFLLISIYIAIALTYSRSSLLALLISSLYANLKTKKNRLFIKVGILIIITVNVLPNRMGEGTNLKRTSTLKAKIDNYQLALSTIYQRPIIGHGYNNLSILNGSIYQPNNHSVSGFDSSLLTISSTTGIIGLFLFLINLKRGFASSYPQRKVALLALLIHSLFSNSLLYSWSIFCLSILFPPTSNNHK